MKQLFARRAVALAAASLLAGSSMIAASPAHADEEEPTTGQLTITVLDHTGKPLPSMIMLIGVDDSSSGNSFQATTGSVTEEVPAGQYAIVSMSPWSGVLCAGVAPCSASMLQAGPPPSTAVTPVVDLPAGGNAAHTLRAVAPAALVGTAKPDGVLHVNLSAPVADLAAIPTPAGSLAPERPQWLSDGVPILGAVGDSYRVRPEDVGRTISAQLTWNPLLGSLFGFSTAPFTTDGLQVSKIETRTKAVLARKKRVRGKTTNVQVSVVAPNRIVTGKVRIKVGKWKRTVSLANGDRRVRLPKLKVGKHKVKVTYLGDQTYSPSKAKTKKLKIVRKKRRR